MRKLLHIAIGYGSALILAHYLLPHRLLPLLSLIVFALSFAAFFFRDKVRTKILLLMISVSVGLFWNWAHTELIVNRIDELSGTEQTVSAVVLDYPVSSERYSYVLLRLEEPELPNSKIAVYSYDYDISQLKPGEHISIALEFYSAVTKNGIELDSYTSKGIYGCAYVAGEYEYISTDFNRLIRLQKYAALKFKETIFTAFPEDVSPFIAALLTGDKTKLYENEELYFALGSAGLTHIVAVSGMHLSFITGFFRIATGRRRRTAFICIPVIVAFAAVAGFTPSIVRAGIMQIIMLAAPLLQREYDPLTGLSFAFLVLLTNPQAIASISLQLSFAATLGIVIFTPRIYKSLTEKLNPPHRFLEIFVRGIIDVFACSVGALIFTTPLCAVHFGYVALYSVLSNILCLWALTLTFISCFIITLAAVVCMPAGAFLAGIISCIPRAVFAHTHFSADLPYARLYTSNNYFAWWIIFVYIVFFAIYLAKGEKKFRPIIPMCSCIITFALITVFSSAKNDNRLTVTAIDVGQGQSVAAISERATVLIDCGSASSMLSPGEAAATHLFSEGRSSVDLLILTHLHADHANGVAALLSIYTVNAIALPECDNDSIYYNEIVALAKSKDIELYYITDDTLVEFEDISFTLFAPLGSEAVNERGIIVLGKYDEFEFLVTGDVNSDTENVLCLVNDLPDIELLIAGHHGSKYSTGDMLLAETKPDNVFISVGHNSYGHPAPEVIERIENTGAAVYRTDLNGNISITVGRNNG